VHKTNPDRISEEVGLAFMKFLFEKRLFSPAAMMTYKSTLAKLLLWVFDIDISTLLFADFYLALQNIHPTKIPPPLEWALDEVLLLVLSDEFSKSSSLEALTK